VRAVDFGDCGYGYYLYDMGVTLLMLRGFDPDGTQRAAFLRGYGQTRGLSDEHRRCYPVTAARAAALVIDDGQRCDAHGSWEEMVADALGWLKEWTGQCPPILDKTHNNG